MIDLEDKTIVKIEDSQYKSHSSNDLLNSIFGFFRQKKEKTPYKNFIDYINLLRQTGAIKLTGETDFWLRFDYISTPNIFSEIAIAKKVNHITVKSDQLGILDEFAKSNREVFEYVLKSYTNISVNVTGEFPFKSSNKYSLHNLIFEHGKRKYEISNSIVFGKDEKPHSKVIQITDFINGEWNGHVTLKKHLTYNETILSICYDNGRLFLGLIALPFYEFEHVTSVNVEDRKQYPIDLRIFPNIKRFNNLDIDICKQNIIQIGKKYYRSDRIEDYYVYFGSLYIKPKDELEIAPKDGDTIIKGTHGIKTTNFIGHPDPRPGRGMPGADTYIYKNKKSEQKRLFTQ